MGRVRLLSTETSEAVRRVLAQAPIAVVKVGVGVGLVLVPILIAFPATFILAMRLLAQLGYGGAMAAVPSIGCAAVMGAVAVGMTVRRLPPRAVVDAIGRWQTSPLLLGVPRTDERPPVLLIGKPDE